MKKTEQEETWTCNKCKSGTHADPAIFGECPCGGTYYMEVTCSKCGRETTKEFSENGICNVCLNQDSLGNDPCMWEE